MKVFIRLMKAIAISLVVITLLMVGVSLMLWTKGLFLVLAGIGVMVYGFYNWLAYRDATMRKEDRKWGV